MCEVKFYLMSYVFVINTYINQSKQHFAGTNDWIIGMVILQLQNNTPHHPEGLFQKHFLFLCLSLFPCSSFPFIIFPHGTCGLEVMILLSPQDSQQRKVNVPSMSSAANFSF